MGLRQIGARDDFRGARVADVDGGEVLGGTFVSQPQDAAPIFGDLDRHAFADAAEPVELMMGELPKIPNRRVGHPLVSFVRLERFRIADQMPSRQDLRRRQSYPVGCRHRLRRPAARRAIYGIRVWMPSVVASCERLNVPPTPQERQAAETGAQQRKARGLRHSCRSPRNDSRCRPGQYGRWLNKTHGIRS